MLEAFKKKKSLCSAQFKEFPIIIHSKIGEKPFKRRDSLQRRQITCHPPPCPAILPSATSVVRTSHKSQTTMSQSKEPAIPPKYCKLTSRRWFNCAVCYNRFKTRFSFNEHIKNDTHMLATGPEGVEGIFVGEFMLLPDRSKPVDED